MNDQKNSPYLKEIIARYLDGTATAAEIEFLEKQDALIDKKRGGFAEMSVEERQEIKAAIKRGLDQEIGKSSPRIRPMQWIKYAAAILLFAAGTIGIYYYTTPGSIAPIEDGTFKTEITAKSSITPGTNRATIVLEDGSQYQLSEDHTGIVNSANAITYEDGKTIRTNPNASAKIIVPAAGQYRVTLSDGTKVWLNSVSSLKYPIQFTGDERRVTLSGEAYFEVEKDASRPFIVESTGQEIKVLGTKFNITAYSSLPIVTTLLEGSVHVSNGHSSQQLSPGQQLRVEGGKMKLVKDHIDLEEVLAWKNGYFKFNENLESIMNKVARWYDVEVVYKIKPDPDMTFEGKISRDKGIEELFEIIELTKEVRFEIQGRRVTVMK